MTFKLRKLTTDSPPNKWFKTITKVKYCMVCGKRLPMFTSGLKICKTSECRLERLRRYKRKGLLKNIQS